uniref:Uncharacterized protein n=1 Tax=Rousettus aegyptiacus TaxID=9407 RepID=A0A7J8F151_ROUAE|nr:hypothetical protein HJG63_012213 [Rousettus aegyptiacus]
MGAGRGSWEPHGVEVPGRSGQVGTVTRTRCGPRVPGCGDGGHRAGRLPPSWAHAAAERQAVNEAPRNETSFQAALGAENRRSKRRMDSPSCVEHELQWGRGRRGSWLGALCNYPAKDDSA